MSDRVCAGARIPEDIYDLHLREVREKWDMESVYQGVEADRAIREYLDRDEGSVFEEQLRDRCTSVGSSPSKRKKLVSDTDNATKKRVQWRVHPGLKEDLKRFAKENETTFSEMFALALREYWTNPRMERLKTLHEQLDNAIEPWTDQIGNDGVNATVKDRRTAEIAMELGDYDGFSRDELEGAIAEVTSDSDYNRKEYTPLVLEYKGLEEHPKSDDVFIPCERAAEIRENNDDLDESGSEIFEQSFGELTPDDRVLRVRARVYQKAESSNGKAKMERDDVATEFNGDPAKTTIYNLMGRAAESDGYEFVSPHGTKWLQVDVQQVEDDDVLEAIATDDSDSSPTETASADIDRITGAEPVR